MIRRLLLLATVALAVVMTLGWSIAALISWSVSYPSFWLAPRYLVAEEAVAAVFNWVALAAFAVRRALWILVAAQVVGVGCSVAAALSYDPGWILFGTVPSVVTLVLGLLAWIAGRNLPDRNT